MPKEKQPKPELNPRISSIFEDWFNNVANSKVRGASKKLIEFVVRRLLLQDTYWFEKNIDPQTAIDLVNCLEMKAFNARTKKTK